MIKAAAGQVLTATDAGGLTTQYTYDTNAAWNLKTVTVDTGAAPHINAKTQFGYDSYGDINAVTNALSQTSTATYDAARRVHWFL